MTRCPPHQIGEIWSSSPSVAQGYWRDPETTQATFHAYLLDTGEGPFLRTGDLGFLRDGELFVTGRIKDIIIINGLNHYPHDIELTVEKSHPQLRPGCGAAFTVERHYEEHLAIVQEVERGTQEDQLGPIFAAIRHAIWQEHELSVRGIVLVKPGSVPKTSSGKIQRHACRDGYLNGTLQVLGRWRVPEGSEGVPGKKGHDDRKSGRSGNGDPQPVGAAAGESSSRLRPQVPNR